MALPPLSSHTVANSYRRLAMACLCGLALSCLLSGVAVYKAVTTVAQLPPPTVLENLKALEKKLDPLQEMQDIKTSLAELTTMKATIETIGRIQQEQVARQQNIKRDMDALQAQQTAQDAMLLGLRAWARQFGKNYGVPFDDGVSHMEESPP